MLALSALVFACKKDKGDDNGVKITKDSLIGKWEMKVQYRHIVDNNTSKRDTLVLPAGFQGWVFMSNDKLATYLRTPNGMIRDTGIFKVEGSNVIISKPGVAKSDTTKITKFSGSALQAYKKRVSGTNQYTELWFDYKKQ
jgi:hypothetical protein